MAKQIKNSKKTNCFEENLILIGQFLSHFTRICHFVWNYSVCVKINVSNFARLLVLQFMLNRTLTMLIIDYVYIIYHCLAQGRISALIETFEFKIVALQLL